jgi:predicted dithiol-disulfide oxidoreductase (DUF899 family)
MQSLHIVSREEWLTARKALLAREKALSRQRDELSALRRALPWVRVDKPYVFTGPHGAESLADLFDGRGQLIVYHFMLGPGWSQGCKNCSLLADHLDGSVIHLAQRDVTLLAISRAPLAEIDAFKRRMGWRFKWVSSHGSDFNYDFHVSVSPEDMTRGATTYNYAAMKPPIDELPGLSVFAKDESGAVFHTYSTYARGLDMLMGVYNYLDLAPKGRDEDALDYPMSWIKHRDRYGT